MSFLRFIASLFGIGDEPEEVFDAEGLHGTRCAPPTKKAPARKRTAAKGKTTRKKPAARKR